MKHKITDRGGFTPTWTRDDDKDMIFFVEVDTIQPPRSNGPTWLKLLAKRAAADDFTEDGRLEMPDPIKLLESRNLPLESHDREKCYVVEFTFEDLLLTRLVKP